MTNLEKDKLIVEALGECWHEWIYNRLGNEQCNNCGQNPDPQIDIGPEYTPFLASPEGFFWWWERAQKMEWWEDFVQSIGTWLVQWYIAEEFIDPVRGRDTLAEWLMGKKKLK